MIFTLKALPSKEIVTVCAELLEWDSLCYHVTQARAQIGIFCASP